MTVYAIPNSEDFSTQGNNKMGPVNYAGYASNSTVSYPTAFGDVITGSAALKSVHSGPQFLFSMLEFSSAQAELYMQFILKMEMAAIADGNDASNLIQIRNKDDGGSPLITLGPVQTSVNGPPRLNVDTRLLGGGTQTDQIAVALADNLYHAYLLHWKYGAGDGEVGLWVDGADVFSLSGLTMDVNNTTAGEAGIRISSADAGNDYTYTFDLFKWWATMPELWDRANFTKKPGINWHV